MELQGCVWDVYVFPSAVVCDVTPQRGVQMAGNHPLRQPQPNGRNGYMYPTCTPAAPISRYTHLEGGRRV
jgi:hypothetical protein